jgi:hypothetical protein
MIKNEQQYRITKAQTQKFMRALAELENCAEYQSLKNPLLFQAQRSALEVQLKGLR